MGPVRKDSGDVLSVGSPSAKDGSDFATSEPATKRPKRLLVVKLGAIGDVVMAIPAAAGMHAAGYAVDWVAGHTVAPVLELYPWIHVLRVEEAGLLHAGALGRLRHIARLWARLLRRAAAEGPYDLCAVLYYDRRYRLLTLPMRARRYLQLSATDRHLRLLPGRHHTDEYARILASSVDTERPGQLSPVRPPALPANPRPSVGDRPRVVLVPAGARNALRDDGLRRWPVESYVAVAEALLAQGCEVLLSGGPDDRWASPSFAALAVAHPASFADLTGSLSLVGTIALLDSAAVTVTHDTGPLHLAGITSTAIVSLFGPTDPRGRLPQRANCVALWGGEGFACRPCYDGRDYAPCAHNGCMRQISAEWVVAEVNRLLEARREGVSLPPRVLTSEHTPVLMGGPQTWSFGGAR